MKKQTILVICSLLELLLIIPVLGCSNDNDESGNSETSMVSGNRHIDGRIITISGDEMNYDGLYNFMEKGLPLTSDPMQKNAFNLESNTESCYFINSYEELRSIYTGDDPLPEIDFDSYTIIIGKVFSANLYDSLDKQSFYEIEGKYSLDLFFSGALVIPVFVYYNYWGLYPKISRKDINVNIIYNPKEVNND
jgi:hypothetical protein